MLLKVDRREYIWYVLEKTRSYSLQIKIGPYKLSKSRQRLSRIICNGVLHGEKL